MVPNRKTHVADLLKTKALQPAWFVHASSRVSEAITLFNQSNFSPLLVLNEGDVVGCLRGRDLLKSACPVALSQLSDRNVSELMDQKVLWASPEDKISSVSEVMIKNKIRHLPIKFGKKIIGLLNIGDVMSSQVLDEVFENAMLKNYIEGKYPG